MTMRTALLPIALIGLVSAPALAEEPTVEQTVTQELEQDKRHNILTIVYENDLIGGGTDQNYTNGVRFNYIDVSADVPRLAYLIDRIVPTFRINRTTSIYYSFGQNLYTPADISSPVANPNDRPWGAFLYGSIGMVTLTDNHLDEVEATLGVVGPMALGEPVQRLVHKYITDSPLPQGWDNQIKNEPGLILAWQRSWPMALSGNIGDDTFWSFKPYAGTTLGNIYTYADVGFTVRLSPEDSKFQDTPVRVRPAMPGTGIYEVPRNKWSWALFAGLEGRAVARNIFLDGNSFRDSASVDKNIFVADANAGVALTYDVYRLSYTMVYRTKEFDTQKDPELFGAISASIRF